MRTVEWARTKFWLLLFSSIWVLTLFSSSAMAGTPRAFTVGPASELRVWITQQIGGVVQPPSIGQPPSVSALSGSVAAEKEGSQWTLTDVDMAAEDLTVSFLYPMSDISIENSSNLVGLENDSIVSLDQSACTPCTDFAVGFVYSFGTRPPVSQPIVDPLQLLMELQLTITGSVLTLSGVASDGFIAIYQNTGVPLGTLPIWIELDMVLVEVPVEPTEMFEMQSGSEIRIYETAVVGGDAQPPTPGQMPSATSALTGVVESDRDVDFWTFTLVNIDAADTTITLPGLTAVDLTDMTLDMPFASVPDADGVLQTVTQLNGLETGGVLSVSETACLGCTDFAARFGFTLGSLSPMEVALIEPLDLTVSMGSSGTDLNGTFATGTVLPLGQDVGIWIEGELALAAPEPSTVLLGGSALLCLGLLSRRMRPMTNEGSRSGRRRPCS